MAVINTMNFSTFFPRRLEPWYVELLECGRKELSLHQQLANSEKTANCTEESNGTHFEHMNPLQPDSANPEKFYKMKGNLQNFSAYANRFAKIFCAKCCIFKDRALDRSLPIAFLGSISEKNQFLAKNLAKSSIFIPSLHQQCKEILMT